METGIFGGTFDPVHLGHLRVAEEVRESFALDRIIFIPVFMPPHKRGQGITGAEDRLKMLKSGIRGNRYFAASDIEITRKGVSYTIDTLKALEKRCGNLYFIIGNDAFAEIDTWRDYRELFFHTHFVVMTRPALKQPSLLGMLPPDVKRDVKVVERQVLEHRSGKKIYLKEITQMDISSTKIRQLTRDRKSIRYLVPGPVERYIRQRGLYRV